MPNTTDSGQRNQWYIIKVRSPWWQMGLRWKSYTRGYGYSMFHNSTVSWHTLITWYENQLCCFQTLNFTYRLSFGIYLSNVPSRFQSRRQLNNPSVPKSEIICQMTDLDLNMTGMKEAIMCDGKPNCDSFEDECAEECFRNHGLIPPFCELKGGCVSSQMVCNGIRESQKLKECNYTYVAQEEENCPNRFYCGTRNGTLLSIDNDLVCRPTLYTCTVYTFIF